MPSYYGQKDQVVTSAPPLRLPSLPVSHSTAPVRQISCIFPLTDLNSQ